MKYEFIHQGDRFFSLLPSFFPPSSKTPVYTSTEARARAECSLVALFSRVGERAMRIAGLRVGVRTYKDGSTQGSRA